MTETPPAPAAPPPAPPPVVPPPATPPPATPPPEAPPAAPPAAPPPPLDKRLDPAHAEYDPVYKGLLAGLGIAVGETPAATPEVPVGSSVGRTLSDTLKFADERRAGEAPPADPAAAPAAATPAGATPPAVPGATAPAAAPAVPAVEVEKRKPIEQVVKAAIKEAFGEQTPAQPPPAPAPPAEPAPDPFEATLTDGEREDLAFARYWAAKDPTKKDLPAQFLNSFKKTAEYIQKNALEEGRTLDENDPDFVRFVRANRPQISPVDRRKVERQQWIDEAATVARSERERDLQDVRRRQHILENQPKVEHAVRAYVDQSEQWYAGDAASPMAPIVKRAREVGWDQAQQEDPIFGSIVRQYHENATRLAATYESLITGVQEFDLNKPDHQWLHTFVTTRAAAFAANGGDARLKEGRIFLPPGQYSKLNAVEQRKHWSWDDRDVLALLARNTKENIEKDLKSTQDRLTAAGFTRAPRQPAPAQLPNGATPTAPPPPPAAPAAPPASPRATPSASPGAATPGAPPRPVSAFEPEYIRSLGLPVKA